MITKIERIDIYPTELRFTEANLPRALPPAPLKQLCAADGDIDDADDDGVQLDDAERWARMSPQERADALLDRATANDAARMAQAYALRNADRRTGDA